VRLPALPLLAAALALLPPATHANDGAAETAAGGIRLREERRVAMRKERLVISKVKAGRAAPDDLGDRYHVSVSYEFVADAEGPDVRTEVAFPLPEYGYGFIDVAGTRRIGGFSVEVDGQPVRATKVVRAYVEQREVTQQLAAAGLDAETFAGFSGDWRSPGYAVGRLPPAQREALVAEGTLYPEIAGEPFALGPRWSVVVTYHWRQLFPAGKVVRIRHEFDAIAGLAYTHSANDLASDPRMRGCFDAPLVKAVEAAQRRRAEGEQLPLVYAHWVGYILTTANTWKTPIADFELDVDFPEGEFASFCWDGPVERLGKTRLRAARKDFVPAEELKVYFLEVGERPPGAKRQKP
jgi:hypothetical protein